MFFLREISRPFVDYLSAKPQDRIIEARGFPLEAKNYSGG
jgi:hypothetical protein